MNKKLFVNGHEFGTKCFEMQDGFAAELETVVEEGGDFEERDFEDGIDAAEEREDEGAEDDGRGDAVRDELVELAADVQELLGALLLEDQLRDLVDEQLPVGLRQHGVDGEGERADLGGF